MFNDKHLEQERLPPHTAVCTAPCTNSVFKGWCIWYRCRTLPLFSSSYMEFEFTEEEAVWAFPASLFLQTIDGQLWWGRCGLFCCFWLFDTSLCQSLGWHTGQFCACFLPPERGARRCFAPVIVPCGEYLLTDSAGYRAAGSFFWFILYLNGLPPEACLCLTCPDAFFLGILLLWQLLPRAWTENEPNRWN